MVPHGDRIDSTKSCRVENKIGIVRRPEENVMRVLILDYDVVRAKARVLPHRPFECLVERLKAFGLFSSFTRPAQRRIRLPHRKPTTDNRK